MESSGRNGDDAERPAGDGSEPVRLPLERSPEGRFVVRSSSHPPTDRTSAVDSSGVHSRPQAATPVVMSEPAPAREGDKEKGRRGRSTPAERPRKRKELKQGGTYVADVRARCDTPRALPGTRTSDRPSRGTSAAEERSVPALAALASAPASDASGNEARNVDEVTRRVRRPASPALAAPPALDASPWRALAAAAFIVALFVIAVWLLG